jgi:hypothetical protein
VEAVAEEPLTVEGQLLTEIRDALQAPRAPGTPATPGTPG